MESSAQRVLREALQRARFVGLTPREAEANKASLHYWGHQYEDLLPWGTPDTPLRDKRPSVRVNMTKAVVDEFVSHLFGEERQPSITLEDGADSDDRVGDILRQLDVSKRLPEVARLGGLHGSLAIGFHIIDQRLDLELIRGAQCRARFGRDDRALAVELGLAFDDLLELDERWVEIEEEGGQEVQVWHRRVWGTHRMVEYVPVRGAQAHITDLKWVVDEETSVQHDLGFVPAVWVKNIEVADDNDGAPLLSQAEFDIEDEINYTLSQSGRGIRYNQEPTLVISNVPVDPSKTKIRRGGNNTIQLEPDLMYDGLEPKAELLELEGGGQAAALAYCQDLTSRLLMVARVVKHDPERAAGVMSGVAMRQLKEPLIGLIKHVRPNYGGALALLVQKALAALAGEQLAAQPGVDVSWPPVVPPTVDDLMLLSGAVSPLMADGLVDRKLALTMLQPHLGIEDVDAYMDRLEDDVAAQGTQALPAAPGLEGLDALADGESEPSLEDI